ncbi:4-hydroxyphenylpyruvate dioxygenase, partial [Vibrio parahaemolyticus V-223/04]
INGSHFRIGRECALNKHMRISRMRQFMNVKLAEVDSSALRHIFIINMRQPVGVSGKVTYAHALLTSP